MAEQPTCPLTQSVCPPLSEAQIEAIATRAAKVALQHVYTEIGKSVVQKVLWLAGAGALALCAWAKGKGLA